MRRGVSLLEVLIVIAILAVVAVFSVPLLRTYQARSDLNLATEQVIQGLTRAKMLSQSADKDAPWGFYVPHGVLYKGTSYRDRDQQYDEVYPMPSTISLSGSSILETSYSKVAGRPSETGSIILTAVDGEQRTITITIAVKSEGIAANQGATLEICHHGPGVPQTITIVESAWQTYHDNFPTDFIGSCPVLSSSSAASSVSSTASSGVSSTSVGSSSSAGGGGGGGSSSGPITICHRPGTAAQQTMTIQPSAWSGHQGHGDTQGACGGTGGSLCPSRFTYDADMTIETIVPLDLSVTAIASQLTWGVGGPTVPVTVKYTKNDGGSWNNLFGGDAISPGLTGSVSNIPAGSDVAFKMRARYRQYGWLLYDQSYATNDGTYQTVLLRSGDPLPEAIISHSVQGQQDLRIVLANYLDANGNVNIDPSAVLVLTEYTPLQYPPPDAQDFQDAILLFQFNARSGGPSCP